MGVIARLALWLAACLAAVLSLIWALPQSIMGTSRGFRVLLAQDQALNAAAFGGSNRETISSHAGKAMLRGERWGCVLCKMLDKFERGHCLDAVDNTVGKPTN